MQPLWALVSADSGGFSNKVADDAPAQFAGSREAKSCQQASTLTAPRRAKLAARVETFVGSLLLEQ
jgi:hypothetical protein